MHPESVIALAFILLTFAAHMLLPRPTAASTSEPESARHMRERVESLAAQLRSGEISSREWQAAMAAYRSESTLAARR